jgi:DNA-binding NarL/FixJ family response regulator
LSRHSQENEMEPFGVPHIIRVAVRIHEPLLHAGTCAALDKQPGIYIVDDLQPCTHRVDVLVLDDLSLRALPGQEAQHDEGQTRPRVVAVTAGFQAHAIRSAFRRGVHGLLLRAVSESELVRGIRSVAAGENFLCEGLASQYARPPGKKALTSREEEVLLLLARGMCNKSIGRHLGIATQTVKSHVKSIMAKLNAKTRTEAASVAFESGMTANISGLLPQPKGDAGGHAADRSLGWPTY